MNTDQRLLNLAHAIRRSYTSSAPRSYGARCVRRLLRGRARRLIRDTYPTNYDAICAEFDALCWTAFIGAKRDCLSSVTGREVLDAVSQFHA